MTRDDVAEVLGISLRPVHNGQNEGFLPAPSEIGGRVDWHPTLFYSWLGTSACAA